MFYSKFILNSQGPLGVVWHAAHWDVKKNVVNETQIDKKVEYIVAPAVPIALRTCGHLLVGVVKIYSRKAKYLLNDASDALSKIKVAFRPGTVDLPEHQLTAAANTITLNDRDVNTIGTVDLDQALLDVGLDDYIQNADLITAADHDILLNERDPYALEDIDVESTNMIEDVGMVGGAMDEDLEIEAGRDAAQETSFRPDIEQSLNLSIFDNDNDKSDRSKGKEKPDTLDGEPTTIELARDADITSDPLEISLSGNANDMNLDLDLNLGMSKDDFGLGAGDGDFNLDLDLEGGDQFTIGENQDEHQHQDISNVENAVMPDPVTFNVDSPEKDALEGDGIVQEHVETSVLGQVEEEDGLDNMPLAETTMNRSTMNHVATEGDSVVKVSQAEATRKTRLPRRRRKGVVHDEQTVLSAEQMKFNLSDVSDLLNRTPLDQLVPTSRKARHYAELEYYLRPERALHMPSTLDLPPTLAKLVTRNLRRGVPDCVPKRAEDDLSDTEETNVVGRKSEETAMHATTATEHTKALVIPLNGGSSPDMISPPEFTDDLLPMDVNIDVMDSNDDHMQLEEPSAKRMRLDEDLEGDGSVLTLRDENGFTLDLSLNNAQDEQEVELEQLVPDFGNDDHLGQPTSHTDDGSNANALDVVPSIESAEALENRDGDEYEATSSSRTASMVTSLQHQFKDNEELQFSVLMKGQNKRTAAAALFEILALKTRNSIDVKQTGGPYSDITLTPLDGFMPADPVEA
eukprot:CFRG0469T1